MGFYNAFFSLYTVIYDLFTPPKNGVCWIESIYRWQIKLSQRPEVFSVFDKVENMLEKGENAGYLQFVLFLQCCNFSFSYNVLKSSFFKSGFCGKGLEIPRQVKWGGGGGERGNVMKVLCSCDMKIMQ